MKCVNCGNEIMDGSQYCEYCGAVQAQTSVLSQQPVSQQPVAAQSYAPALQLPTNRGLAKMIFLSLITFGIYGIVTWCKIVTEINITASRYDGKRTCPYFAALCLSAITYGIFSLVWQHKFSARVGAEVRRRGYNYNFGAADMWLWGILGSLIIV